MFLLDPDLTTNTLIQFGAKANFKIVDGQLFRLISPMFLHANFYHILFNSLALYIIGNQVEKIFGVRKFLMVYFISGIIGSIGSFVTNDFVAVGASAGIFGLMGTHLYLFLYNRDGYRHYFGNDFLFLIGINVVYGFMNPSVDNAAHLFGLIGGLLVSLLLLKKIPYFRINQRVIAITGLIIILGLFGMKFQSYSDSPDYYFSKSIYYVREEFYDEAYSIAVEGLETHPEDISLKELVDAFVVQ
jgi:rhomboid protease GluP